MRSIPPLALIPLIIIWFGIWEQGKISLLFLAALWIMPISARARSLWCQHLQGARGLFTGGLETAGALARHHPQFTA